MTRKTKAKTAKISINVGLQSEQRHEDLYLTNGEIDWVRMGYEPTKVENISFFGSKIKNLDLNVMTNCMDIRFTNCPELTNVTIGRRIETLMVKKCKSVKYIDVEICKYGLYVHKCQSLLTIRGASKYEYVVENCESLIDINVNGSTPLRMEIRMCKSLVVIVGNENNEHSVTLEFLPSLRYVPLGGHSLYLAGLPITKLYPGDKSFRIVMDRCPALDIPDNHPLTLLFLKSADDLIKRPKLPNLECFRIDWEILNYD